jgi:hypothetical protein
MSASRPRLPVLTLLLVTAACSGASETEADPGQAGPPDPLPMAIALEAEARGSAAAAALAQGLAGRLGAAIEERGTVGAIDFCADEALELTRAIARDHDPTLALKRTTSRWRNPANAPDEAEARVLRYLEALEAEEPGSAPETLTAAGPDGGARFYRTLRAAPMCLQCHGAERDIDPEVMRILRERYPDDRATGYEAGEFRGVIRVDLPAAPAAPEAR